MHFDIGRTLRALNQWNCNFISRRTFASMRSRLPYRQKAHGAIGVVYAFQATPIRDRIVEEFKRTIAIFHYLSRLQSVVQLMAKCIQQSIFVIYKKYIYIPSPSSFRLQLLIASRAFLTCLLRNCSTLKWRILSCKLHHIDIVYYMHLHTTDNGNIAAGPSQQIIINVKKIINTILCYSRHSVCCKHEGLCFRLTMD